MKAIQKGFTLIELMI
ncbi:MAG: prepilin-type N-terminal cleavage/methylation domain-containing protein, partial [Ottowia sp.]